MNHFYQNIHGWSTPLGQINLIKYIMPKIIGKLVIAEIGVWKGRGTAMWNVELINNNREYDYFAIDHFRGSEEHHGLFDCDKLYNEALENLQPISDKINLIKGESSEVATSFKNNFFDIIYIDASHDYTSVKKDIEVWLPKLKMEGIICGDDYFTHKGVTDAVIDVFGRDKVKTPAFNQWLVEKNAKEISCF